MLPALLAVWSVWTPSGACAQSRTGQMSVVFAAESEEPAPGSTTMLVLRMTPMPGWHGYWRNPGQSGGETRLDWTAPEGVVMGRPGWPAPIASTTSGMVSYVMDGPYSILVPMTVPRSFAPGRAFTVGVDVLLFVCTEGMCSSQKVDGSVDLVVGAGSPSTTGAPLVAQARRSMPVQGTAEALHSPEGLHLVVSGAGLDPARARVFMTDPSSPTAPPLRVVAGPGGSTAFDLGWTPKGPFQGVATDGSVSVAFSSGAPHGSPSIEPAVVTAGARPVVPSTSPSAPARGYVAAAADAHHEPQPMEDPDGWGGVVHAAMAAAFLAAVGGIAILLGIARRRMCRVQACRGTSAADRPTI